MMKLSLIFIFFIITTIGHSQQQSYDYLVNAYCHKLENYNFDNLKKEEIIVASSHLSQEFRAENMDSINHILQYIAAHNDTLSEMEVLIIYSKHYLHDIIYNCNKYLEISRISIDSCPTETKSLQYIALRYAAYLNQHTNYNYTQILDSLGSKSYEYSKEIKEQLVLDYDFEFISPNILINYLLHKNDPYFRAWLYNQSMRLFK